jgi:hypothetical protein
VPSLTTLEALARAFEMSTSRLIAKAEQRTSQP